MIEKDYSSPFISNTGSQCSEKSKDLHITALLKRKPHTGITKSSFLRSKEVHMKKLTKST